MHANWGNTLCEQEDHNQRGDDEEPSGDGGIPEEEESEEDDAFETKETSRSGTIRLGSDYIDRIIQSCKPPSERYDELLAFAAEWSGRGAHLQRAVGF